MSISGRIKGLSQAVNFLKHSAGHYRNIVKGKTGKHEGFPNRERCETLQRFSEAQGLSYEIIHPDRLYANWPCIYIANHASLLEPLILCMVLDRDVRFLAKESVFKVPFLGRCMRHEQHIVVYRGSKRSKNRSIQAQMQRALTTESASIIIFPEGTRSKDGQLQPFKLGAFIAAIRQNMPIVPIVFRGTHALMPKGVTELKPGHVTLEIGEAHYGDFDAYADDAAELAAAEALRDRLWSYFDAQLSATHDSR